MAKAIWAVSEGDRASLGCAGGGIALTHDKVAILVKRLSQECDKIAYPILQPYKLTLVQYKIIKYLYNFDLMHIYLLSYHSPTSGNNVLLDNLFFN